MRRLRAKTLTARRSRIDNTLANARKIILGQISQTNLPEVAGIPALLMGRKSICR